MNAKKKALGRALGSEDAERGRTAMRLVGYQRRFYEGVKKGTRKVRDWTEDPETIKQNKESGLNNEGYWKKK